jgi:hypothetical protein
MRQMRRKGEGPLIRAIENPIPEAIMIVDVK